ncbi:hypothetical protein M569_10303 [Genlisea aurea]|uniref:Uncharacterized protein n=1 Tax=Genlisea aurea TaxID=192259 RepID=S8DNA1_9LAMI|nr:hypothetical protein M569_10303 [Genlisea aurea]
MLISWLKESNGRERELREHISQFLQAKKPNGSEQDDILSTTGGGDDDDLIVISADSNATAIRARAALRNRYGGIHSRCECLELLWPAKFHCPSCHQSFPTVEEHSADSCKSIAVVKSPETEDDCKLKKAKLGEGEEEEEDFTESSPPFSFQEIMTRFNVQCSVKETVNEIGLIGRGGVPEFSFGGSPYLGDPSLSLRSSRIRSRASVRTAESKEESSMRFAEGGSSSVQEGYSAADILKKPSESHRSSRLCCEASSRPLAGKAFEAVRFLKIDLLDMEAAMPEDGLRRSRSTREKRCAWRAYVKSSRSIHEMIQALIVFEDMIKSEYLRNDWWFWSSPSTAAKIGTLSALALRIYSLDAAIYYEKAHSGGSAEPG